MIGPIFSVASTPCVATFACDRSSGSTGARLGQREAAEPKARGFAVRPRRRGVERILSGWRATVARASTTCGKGQASGALIEVAMIRLRPRRLA